MHVEYWICDYCKKEIDYNEKTKFTTPEMGIPFIPEGGGGKHFHYNCLVSMYNKKKNLTNKEKAEKIADAERRHENQLIRLKIKQGNLTKGKIDKRKSCKKDREALFNYFYDFYGLISATNGLKSYIDRLNDGDDFGEIKGVKIPYEQLKEMLIYYRKELDSTYKSKLKKGEKMSPLQRIFYDVTAMINSTNDFLNRPEILYNQVIHNQIDGGEKIFDNSQYIATQKHKKKTEKEQMIEDIDEFLNSLDDLKEE